MIIYYSLGVVFVLPAWCAPVDLRLHARTRTYMFFHLHTYIDTCIHVYILNILNAFDNIQETRLGAVLLSRTTIVTRLLTGSFSRSRAESTRLAGNEWPRRPWPGRSYVYTYIIRVYKYTCAVVDDGEDG